MLVSLPCAKKPIKSLFERKTSKSIRNVPVTLDNAKTIHARKLKVFVDKAKESGNEDYSNCLHKCMDESVKWPTNN